MTNFTPRTISPEEFKQLELAYEDALGYAEKMEPIWAELHAYFKTVGPQEDWQYFGSFFRWYTEITWTRPSLMNDDEFSVIAIGRQLPMALLMDFDVWKVVVTYLSGSQFSEKERVNTYAHMQSSLISSEAMMSDSLMLKDVVKEITAIEKSQSASIGMAETQVKLTREFFGASGEKLGELIKGSGDEVIKSLIAIIHFFMGVKPEGVSHVIDMYFQRSPDIVDDSVLEQVKKDRAELGGDKVDQLVHMSIFEDVFIDSADESVVADEPVVKTEQQSVSHDQPLFSVKPSAQGAEGSVEVENQLPVPTLESIKTEVLRIANENEPEIILGTLSNFADTYGDPRIKDLYVYNESLGEFEWFDAFNN